MSLIDFYRCWLMIASNERLNNRHVTTIVWFDSTSWDLAGQ